MITEFTSLCHVCQAASLVILCAKLKTIHVSLNHDICKALFILYSMRNLSYKYITLVYRYSSNGNQEIVIECYKVSLLQIEQTLTIQSNLL